MSITQKQKKELRMLLKAHLSGTYVVPQKKAIHQEVPADTRAYTNTGLERTRSLEEVNEDRIHQHGEYKQINKQDHSFKINSIEKQAYAKFALVLEMST